MQSFDPDFEEGATLRDLSGIQKMAAGTVRYGNFEPAEGLDQWWTAVTGKLLVQERADIVVEAFKKFEGANIAIDETSADGTQVEDCVLIETPPAPVLVSAAPASGTKAGNAVLNITGENFQPARPAPLVLVGGAYASSVARTEWYSLRRHSGKKPPPGRLPLPSVFVMSRQPSSRKKTALPWCAYLSSPLHIVGCRHTAVTLARGTTTFHSLGGEPYL